jgi:NAD(P)-dependent dehydrogenase (short-subunit alcohol dehydrogenase family)
MKTVIVTGSNSGIGRAIVRVLTDSGYDILGIDKVSHDNKTIAFDLSKLTNNDGVSELSEKIQVRIAHKRLFGIVNNAATQKLGSLETLDLDDFNESILVNLSAPLVLSKICYPYLKKTYGHIINIGTIHTELTKPSFISYATSKSGLKGLTKSLAVDVGKFVKVNMISPAAIATDMLLAGFKDKPDQYKNLQNHHPSNSIGNPEDVALMVKSILDNDLDFVNGSIFQIDGGIASRLHDPG